MIWLQRFQTWNEAEQENYREMLQKYQGGKLKAKRHFDN